MKAFKLYSLRWVIQALWALYHSKDGQFQEAMEHLEAIANGEED